MSGGRTAVQFCGHFSFSKEKAIEQLAVPTTSEDVEERGGTPLSLASRVMLKRTSPLSRSSGFLSTTTAFWPPASRENFRSLGLNCTAVLDSSGHLFPSTIE